jgi:hypothetical protein
MAPKKRQLNQAQAIKMAPSVKKFNAISRILIRLLSEKIEQKERALGNISVMVNSGFKAERRNSISITTIDINKTSVNKKGGSTYNQSMPWEEQLRRQKRGLIL